MADISAKTNPDELFAAYGVLQEQLTETQGQLARTQEQLEDTEKRLADVMGDGGSFRNLQVKLDDHLAEREAAIKDAAEKAAAEVAAKYEAHIAELKAKTLIPALKDLQARQRADLEAKQAAELASL